MCVVDSALKPSKCSVYQLITQAGVITVSSVVTFLSLHCVHVCVLGAGVCTQGLLTRRDPDCLQSKWAEFTAWTESLLSPRRLDGDDTVSVSNNSVLKIECLLVI